MKSALLCSLVLYLCLIGSAAQAAPDSQNLSWTERVLTEDELLKLEASEPGLDINTCREILSRLNTKESFYIRDDMRNGRKIKVPNDFNAYKDWSPMPIRLPASLGFAKFILVVKDIPFLGWYESGVLVSDSQACIGKSGQDTQPGFYRIEDKDADHVSRSYPNEFGNPAWMPFSMRIYEAVYIHAGNVFGARCSHGCVTLPIERAEMLFSWTEPKTVVLVLESLDDLKKASLKIPMSPSNKNRS
jgi:hypothetical protein